ncbi:hypothetical protein ANN_04766 [Periplaneta americana]|uniref:Uncharacterized protein n=1 Tax=Periplaneta americana TaxID=6978 RepID=A0ABQ8TAW3_PERAM|nr:hypothetical protein ANN_04766 [Periplaneta americana]
MFETLQFKEEIRKEIDRCLDSSRQHSLKCAKGKRSHPVCPVVQQEEVESIPASSYECTMVHCVLRGPRPILSTPAVKAYISHEIHQELLYSVKLQNEIAVIDQDIERLQSGFSPTTKNRKYVNTDARISRIVERYENYKNSDDILGYLLPTGHNIAGNFYL